MFDVDGFVRDIIKLAVICACVGAIVGAVVAYAVLT